MTIHISNKPLSYSLRIQRVHKIRALKLDCEIHLFFESQGIGAFLVLI